jgi:glycosyltransferase involved in cell wall biosynthesis
MAAGRPALYVGPERSEVARTVAAERMGACVGNGDVDGLVEAITRRAMDEGLRRDEGARAREAFDRDHSRSRRTSQFARLLESLA